MSEYMIKDLVTEILLFKNKFEYGMIENHRKKINEHLEWFMNYSCSHNLVPQYRRLIVETVQFIFCITRKKTLNECMCCKLSERILDVKSITEFYKDLEQNLSNVKVTQI